MKEIIKEEIRKFTKWEAIDGTEFNNENECRTYEESARGVLRGRLAKITVNNKYSGWDLMGGNDDNKIIAIKPANEKDVDTILQCYYLDQPYILKDNYKKHKLEIEFKVNEALKTNDVVLFGLNCEDELYFIDNRMDIVNRLLNLENETK